LRRNAAADGSTLRRWDALVGQRERGVVSSSRSALLSATQGIHQELREIKAALTTIASVLTMELEQPPGHHHPHPDAKLLSLREAARRLGVDRNTTLRALIRTGQLRTVNTGGRPRIPAAEVERFAKVDRTGDAPRPVPTSAPTRSRRMRSLRRSGPATDSDIRDLDF
jgi:excisionase family DNA binding protein